jgi:hypothetical protein
MLEFCQGCNFFACNPPTCAKLVKNIITSFDRAKLTCNFEALLHWVSSALAPQIFFKKKKNKLKIKLKIKNKNSLIFLSCGGGCSCWVFCDSNKSLQIFLLGLSIGYQMKNASDWMNVITPMG